MSSYDERESPDKATIVEEEEEQSDGNGEPQPPTELFKGQDMPRSGAQVYCLFVCLFVCCLYILLSHFEFFPWEILGRFPQEKPAATESRYPTLINYKVHAVSFRVSTVH